MGFATIRFALFSLVLLILYYRVPKRAQWVVLLMGSYIFYLCSGIRYLVFLLITTLSSYGAGCVMAQNWNRRSEPKAQIKKRNRRWMTACLALNFSVLGFCKVMLITSENWMIPLGISFYMFQSMGYVVDVYRGTAKAETNLLRFALFVSYFPQLVQGPISRFSQLAPQLCTAHEYDAKQVSFGLQRMLWGYFKKLVIADRIAVAVAALRGPEYTGISFLVLTVFYALQIYGDFTGGIDIALGLSQALGITLPENFHRPFFSKSIAEYWRRWHITLGTWMKDYIFYPISISAPMLRLSKTARKRFGNFGKRLPVYIASVATWFVTGIWHGLTPNFILWGLLNCLFILLSEELTPLYKRFHARFGFKNRKWYSVWEMLRTFVLMNLIRACDLFPDTSEYFRRIGSLLDFRSVHMLWDGTLMGLGLSGLDYGILCVGVVSMLTVSLFQEKKGSLREMLWQRPVLRHAVLFVLFLAVLLMGSYGIGYNQSSFIYNQF